MPPVGFEPTISAGERPQTYALDRAATGIGDFKEWPIKMTAFPSEDHTNEANITDDSVSVPRYDRNEP